MSPLTLYQLSQLQFEPTYELRIRQTIPIPIS